MYRLLALGVSLVSILFLALAWAPSEAGAESASLAVPSALICMGEVCNKYDPDVDCWDGEIFWQNGCTEGMPWCDGVETVE